MLQISAEELNLHGGVVVCPQCLTEFHTEAGDRDTNSPTLLTRSRVVVPEHLTYRYCHECGMKIPEGVHYCPYCGHMLQLVGDAAPLMSESETEQPDLESDTPQTDEPQAATDVTEAEKPQSTETKPTHRSEREWSPVLPSYRSLSRQARVRHKASRGFCLVAFVVILALLALLAYILYKVYMLRNIG